MAGSISLSMSQQFDASGKPLIGGKVYFFAANTTTPQNAFKDTGLLLPHPNPLPLAGAGRVPEFYLADGNIHFRLVDKNGLPQLESQNALVIGPSSGGGGGSTVDATAIFQTGDSLWVEVQGTRAGWVRDNALTIGSATSGAGERANADCQSLFVWIWAHFSDAVCPVVGGRGLTAAADWAANKQITLPDKRGFVPGGLDDMGNTAAGRFANVPVIAGGVTTAGSTIGEPTHTLVTAEIPAHSHGVSDTHTHPMSQFSKGFNTGPQASNLIADSSLGGSAVGNTGIANVGAIGINNAGGGGAHNVTQRTVLGTFYRKL